MPTEPTGYRALKSAAEATSMSAPNYSTAIGGIGGH